MDKKLSFFHRHFVSLNLKMSLRIVGTPLELTTVERCAYSRSGFSLFSKNWEVYQAENMQFRE